MKLSALLQAIIRRLKIRDAAALFPWVVLLFFLTGYGLAWGAVGCDLNDPDRDVSRIFPQATGYRPFYTSVAQRGGPALLARIEQRLGDKLHPVFEAVDVPYSVYELLRKTQKIGYIHGVNQKGRFGSIQVFMALDLAGQIKAFYIQKMSGPSAGKFRELKFGRQFLGLHLQDFEQYDVPSGQATGRVAGIQNPAPEAETDFQAILRAAKKNLILMGELVFQALPRR